MLRHDVVQFVRDNLLQDRSESLDPDDSLIDRGVLDSIGLMQIMTFLEERTGTRIPDHMVTPDHFQSASAIESMMTQLAGGA